MNQITDRDANQASPKEASPSTQLRENQPQEASSPIQQNETAIREEKLSPRSTATSDADSNAFVNSPQIKTNTEEPVLGSNSPLMPSKKLFGEQEAIPSVSQSSPAKTAPVSQPPDAPAVHEPQPPLAHATTVPQAATGSNNPNPNPNANQRLPPPGSALPTVSTRRMSTSQPPIVANNSSQPSGPVATAQNSNPSQNANASSNSLDPRSFMNLAREELRNSPRIMEEFLLTMKEFRVEELGMNEVIVRITRLFKGRRRLLDAFNSFLPENCKIDVDSVMAQTQHEDLHAGTPQSATAASGAPSGQFYSPYPSSSGAASGAMPQMKPMPMHHNAEYHPLLLQPPHASSGWSLPHAAPPSAFPPMGSQSSGGVPQGSSYSLPSSKQLPSPLPHAPRLMPPGMSSGSMPSAIGGAMSQSHYQHLVTQHHMLPMSSGAPSAAGHGSGSIAPQSSSSSMGGGGVSAPFFSAPNASSSSSRLMNAVPPPSTQQQPTQQPPNAAISSIKKEELEPAVKFIQKIRTRFSHEPEVFKTFLEIVDEFQSERKSLSELYKQINNLFAGHLDVIEDFKKFLPEQFEASAAEASNFAKNQGHFQNGTGYGPRPAANKNFSNAGAVQQHAQNPIRTNTSYAPFYSANNASAVAPAAKKLKTIPNIEDYRQSAEELDFFENVKRFFNNTSVYAEFLRCINLFNQDLIGMKELLQMVGNYLGKAPELFQWFKQYVGCRDEVDLGGGIAKDSSDASELPLLDVNRCKKYGSYRLLPKLYRNPVCSGRNSLVSEVLNDFVVSCPQFASEEGSFIASKKNQYEEALFKCEDDRFDLDMLIDANQATILVLEALDKRIQTMPADERSAFKLGLNLGVGTSTTIYRRAISKIYGPDRAAEVMEGLYNNPVAAVPVVLNRLQAKDEEWRKIQRESAKVWREIHAKNYYKALDHQSISFKSNDKKTINVKSLVNEIEAIAKEARFAASSHRTHHHMLLNLQDAGVVRDLFLIITSYIRKSFNVHSHEKKSLIGFFESFIPNLAGISANHLQTETQNGDSNAFTSAESSPGASEIADAEEEAAVSGAEPLAKQSKKNSLVPSHSLYINNQIYAFLKSFEIAYQRLLRLKSAKKNASNAAHEETAAPTALHNQAAHDLDLQSSLQIDAPNTDPYASLVTFTAKFVTGALEQTYFEEKVRYLFGSCSFHLFTFDKLIASITRQAQAILNDAVCDNLLRLFETIRSNTKRSFTDYSIKLAAESIINSDEENLFQIDTPAAGTIGVRLVDRRASFYAPFVASGAMHGEGAFDRLSHGGGAQGTGADSIEEKWSRYIDRFVCEDDYQLVQERRPPLILRRCMLRVGLPAGLKALAALHPPSDEPSHASVVIRYELECKICINTYKMYFVEESEDFILNARHWNRRHRHHTTLRNTRLSPQLFAAAAAAQK